MPLDEPPAWSLRSRPTDELCGPYGRDTARDALRPLKSGPRPARLSDEILDVSPIDAWQLITVGPSSPDGDGRPWNGAIARYGSTSGFGAGFGSRVMAGGFGHAAHEFPTVTSAIDAGIAIFRSVICEWGAEPAAVEQQPGIAVAIVPGTPGQTSAWWVHDDRLVAVTYSMWRERDADLQAALVVIEAAYRVG